MSLALGSPAARSRQRRPTPGGRAVRARRRSRGGGRDEGLPRPAPQLVQRSGRLAAAAVDVADEQQGRDGDGVRLCGDRRSPPSGNCSSGAATAAPGRGRPRRAAPWRRRRSGRAGRRGTRRGSARSSADGGPAPPVEVPRSGATRPRRARGPARPPRPGGRPPGAAAAGAHPQPGAAAARARGPGRRHAGRAAGTGRTGGGTGTTRARSSGTRNRLSARTPRNTSLLSARSSTAPRTAGQNSPTHAAACRNRRRHGWP